MNKLFAKTLIIFAAIGLFCVVQFWNDDENKTVSYNHFLNSDGGGYYNYLPSIFVRHDFGNDTSGHGTIFVTKQGKTINKYYIGTALLDAPFFAIGYIHSWLNGDVINGYNYYLQCDAAIGSLFYFLLGCWFTLLWLKQKFNHEKTAIAALSVTLLSTSIVYYFTYEPFYSHCYSYCFIAMFIYYTHNFFQSFKLKFLTIAAIVYGIIILIRPTNAIIILLIPFLANSLNNIKIALQIVVNNKLNVISIVILSTAIIFIQPLVNYWQCGNFLEWSYKGEGFTFTNPKIFNVLFSFECGIFVYMPISLVAILGILIHFQKTKYSAVTLFAFLFTLLFVLSSWWCYTYGDSMVMRPLTDYTTLGAFTIGVCLQQIKNQINKFILLLLISLSILYNAKIFYQFSHGILHFGNMNFEKYKYTFDKFSEQYYGCLGGNKVQGIFSSKEPKIILETLNKFDKKVSYYSTNNAVVDPQNKANKCLYFNDNEFNDGFAVENDTAIYNSDRLYADILLSRLEVQPDGASDALMVMHLTYPNSAKYFYYTFKINDLPKNESGIWHQWHYTVDVPKPLYPNYKLSFYIWNIKKQQFYIDDVSIKIYRLY